MSKQPRHRIVGSAKSQWESTLEETDGAEGTQAGEFDPGNEDGGGGDKGLDMDTGDGGYSGDAVLEGEEEAMSQPERPLDREIHGDPRTQEGESYPDDVLADDDELGPPGEMALEDEDDEPGA